MILLFVISQMEGQHKNALVKNFQKLKSGGDLILLHINVRDRRMIIRL